MKQDNKEDVANLKSRALTRSISSDSHSVAERSWWFLYNTWTSLAPSTVTHVNSHHVVVLTDSHTAITHHSPARPDTRMYLKGKVIYHTRENVFEHISKHREENWKYDAQRSIFDELRSVKYSGQTPFWVFNISSQLKPELRKSTVSDRKKKKAPGYTYLEVSSQTLNHNVSSSVPQKVVVPIKKAHKTGTLSNNNNKC